MNLASAVTTCPRPNGVSYLDESLVSIRAAGFDPLIVDDPEISGSWTALRRALGLLLSGHPDLDCAIVFQDDIRIARNAARWIEATFWPLPVETIGVCSLYCAEQNHQEQDGWFDLDSLAVYRPIGALAYCFPRHSAEKLVGKPANPGFRNCSDASTATHCRNHGLKYLMHSPSLVQHVGEISSFGHDLGLCRQRRAKGMVEDAMGGELRGESG